MLYIEKQMKVLREPFIYINYYFLNVSTIRYMYVYINLFYNFKYINAWR